MIQAQLGDVALGAGQGINLNFDGDGLLNLQVDKGSVDALAHNGGLIRADGGQVLMSARSADSLLKTVVNNQGTPRPGRYAARKDASSSTAANRGPCGWPASRTPAPSAEAMAAWC